MLLLCGHTRPCFSVLREQWIRAKYQRLEFVDIDKQTYLQGRKEGYLWKRGKEDKKFLQRKFVLDEKTNTLKYYNKEDVRISWRHGVMFFLLGLLYRVRFSFCTVHSCFLPSLFPSNFHRTHLLSQRRSFPFHILIFLSVF